MQKINYGRLLDEKIAELKKPEKTEPDASRLLCSVQQSYSALSI